MEKMLYGFTPKNIYNFFYTMTCEVTISDTSLTSAAEHCDLEVWGLRSCKASML